MKRIIHRCAGLLAFGLILAFWVATVYSELLGDPAMIAAVKGGILWGMIALIPSLAATGASGFSLGGKWKSAPINRKKKRMPFIALNGIVVLLPSAFFLATKASAGELDATFYMVQVVELIFGATNLTLIGLNIRDGLSITGRIRSAA